MSDKEEPQQQAADNLARGVDPWAGLEPAWRECFVLAWEAFQGRSIPVGAVLVNGAGETVAAGRNRGSEAVAPSGQLAGSLIAHAEINALATLPPDRYADHTLYTTLEPCLLCSAALRHSHVGRVRYAAPDPMWNGIDAVPALNSNLARHWARREGPLGGPLQTWSALLHLISAVERGVQSVVDCHAEAMPEVLGLARRLAGPAADALRARTFESGLASVWCELTAVTSAESARL